MSDKIINSQDMLVKLQTQKSSSVYQKIEGKIKGLLNRISDEN